MNYELFNIRDPEFYEKYYPILKGWWEGRREIVHPEFLSTRGIIIKDKDEYICAAWLYTTDSSYGVINWVITNKDSKPRVKKRCLEFMFSKLEEYSKHLGIKIVYLAIETKSLKRILSNQGYLMTSNNISEFFKQII